ncbi:hypothetical protein [Lichenifustis flavocetrariae]|uniref:Uncharacterized protein n=1 Tax=Lichenifustis flavocetrariae TaxID=2949735 RepID=A0AA41YYW8_9HYPH|nr:hypothetical protein [Lichenifustis flavocetrariae]MCW6509840.1 hypothetical protein [Lichenifustis flavocetrariae]
MSLPEPRRRHLGGIRKDAILDSLAEHANVAQFASFAPTHGGPVQQYCRVLGLAPNHAFASDADAVERLLANSADGKVNVRSFSPESAQSRPFVYGLARVDEALDALRSLSAQGLHTIVNELIDVHDGGVSGVALGGLIEFTPDDTPRGVEKPGTAALPVTWAEHVLTAVYGFAPELNNDLSGRVEFSIHPRRCGWRGGHTLLWEHDPADQTRLTHEVAWPNNFSRMLGDKVYGLLVADAAGLRVPRTLVVNRRVAPFSFGQPTGSAETWLRTSPREQLPGKYTTLRGYADPFAFMASEDPDGTAIPSLISQSAVPAVYAGAALELADGSCCLEGRRGEGDLFMLGVQGPEVLPDEVEGAVTALFRQARSALGSVRLEWVFDGHKSWVVQLHRGASASSRDAIVPGEAADWIDFESSQGLEALRSLLARLPRDTGIRIRGAVGLTSHVSDLLRKASIPARFA